MTVVHRVAVVADPHFHDIANRPGGGETAFRTLADTCESTRVFNESYHALTALLDDIVRRGISIVVVAGDLSDDGQESTMTAAVGVLRRYSEQHGLRFFATPGNHDLYAIAGRHQGKRFLDRDGSHTLVTSDPSALQGSSAGRVVTSDMYCGGYADALRQMAPFGFFRDASYLHWETPFGASDALGDRSFDIRSTDGRTVRRMVDASYLVEPVEGLWLLSIDANVFEPRDGDLDAAAEQSYIDSTDAGWNSMLRNKRFILDWMKDVAIRAARLNKRLLTFSHYPVIDPLNGTAQEEARLLGDTGFVRRTPGPDVAAAAAATGIKTHFSGHLHINDTALARYDGGFLVNIAVPSMVGFPPAYKIASFAGDSLLIETILIDAVPHFDAAFGPYRAEVARSGESVGDVLAATSHGDFLSRHLAQLVRCRYLKREWPADLAGLVPLLGIADLWSLAEMEPMSAGEAAAVFADSEARGAAFMDAVVDWYRLRKGRGLAHGYIAPGRIAEYRALARRYVAGSWPGTSVQARIASFFAIMQAYIDSHPSLDFAIDLATGDILDAALGRTDFLQTGTA